MSLQTPGENPDFKIEIRKQVDELFKRSALLKQKYIDLNRDELAENLAQQAETLGMSEPYVMVEEKNNPPFTLIEKADYNKAIANLEAGRSVLDPRPLPSDDRFRASIRVDKEEEK